jgi:outer membrane protein assembly factor BamB
MLRVVTGRILTAVALFAGLASACAPVRGSADSTAGALTTLPAVETTVPPSDAAPGAPGQTTMPTTTTETTTMAPTTTLPPRPAGTVPGSTVGTSWGSVDGLVMFRGNPTRTWYGTGPVPDDPQLLWRFPDAAMCGNSPVGGENVVWCGTGWTGQPVVWNRPDGVTEVIFGAYDKSIHFLDAATGEPTRPTFAMGDIIKGSVSLDPDGFPLLYAGSRDPNFRVIALDRETPTELWSLSATSVSGMWNNDWDSNAVIVDDLLLVGGENSWWFAVKLNRGTNADGLVTVDPEVVASIPAFTDELVRAVGRQQSVESSTAVFGTVAYFSNSAGRIVGVDLADLPGGSADIVFDYWVGDDVDATIVIDEAGFLYVSVEEDLRTARSTELGRLLKLAPTNPGDPVVWGIDIPSRGGVEGGIWATPALRDGLLYVATNPGELLVVDTLTGDILWRDEIGSHAWSSPVIVDDTLVVSVNCNASPALRAYDLGDPRSPVERWEIAATGGCIESTPAVWDGKIYVGSRDGYFYAIGR